jgi:hypothetical protein
LQNPFACINYGYLPNYFWDRGPSLWLEPTQFLQTLAHQRFSACPHPHRRHHTSAQTSLMKSASPVMGFMHQLQK